MEYGKTAHGKRVHILEETRREKSLCDRMIVEMVPGPDFPETLCDFCSQKKKTTAE